MSNRCSFSPPSVIPTTSLDIAIDRRVNSSLTNLGAAMFWLRLLRLMSFPPCAEATSLTAMKKPYERGRKPTFYAHISITTHGKFTGKFSVTRLSK